MPNGFRDAGARDPLNFSRHEWQQAKRTQQDPKAIKEMLLQCWAGSDNRQAFETALREQGYFLARGDRRGYVAVDWRGEVYSLSRATGAKAKDLKFRLGDALDLQSVEQAQAFVSERMTPKLKAWAKEADALAEKQNLAAQFQREQMVQRHRHLREQVKRQQEQRVLSEARQRAERTPSGLRGLWGWITGKNRKIREENEAEMARAQQRDRDEKHSIIQKQLSERRTLQERVLEARGAQKERIQELNRDVAKYLMMGGHAPIEITERFQTGSSRAPHQQEHKHPRGHTGPDFKPR